MLDFYIHVILALQRRVGSDGIGMGARRDCTAS